MEGIKIQTIVNIYFKMNSFSDPKAVQSDLSYLIVEHLKNHLNIDSNCLTYLEEQVNFPFSQFLILLNLNRNLMK